MAGLFAVNALEGTMKDFQTSSLTTVHRTVCLANYDALDLPHHGKVFPAELRITYRSSPNETIWVLIVNKSKTDETRGKAIRELNQWAFKSNGSDTTPAWIPGLLAKYAPADIDNV